MDIIGKHHFQQPHIRRFRHRREPVDSLQPTLSVAPDDRAPAAAAHFQDHILATFDPDRLAVNNQITIAIGSEVSSIVLSMTLQDYAIRPVPITVGIRPGYPAVATGDQQRCTGQGHAGDIQVPTTHIGDLEPRPVPDRGYTLPQMHVVGQQAATMRGPVARQCPVVAARGHFRFVIRHRGVRVLIGLGNRP